jgi:hypothetical protein
MEASWQHFQETFVYMKMLFFCALLLTVYIYHLGGTCDNFRTNLLLAYSKFASNFLSTCETVLQAASCIPFTHKWHKSYLYSTHWMWDIYNILKSLVPRWATYWRTVHKRGTRPATSAEGLATSSRSVLAGAEQAEPGGGLGQCCI